MRAATDDEIRECQNHQLACGFEGSLAPLLDVSRVPLLLIIVLNVAGIASPNPRLHGLIAIVVLAAQGLGLGRI